MTNQPKPDQTDLEWLTHVLGGHTADQAAKHLCRPSLTDPQLLLPLAPRALTVSALRRHHDARTKKDFAIGLLGELAARLGFIQMAGGEVVQMAPFSLVRQLGRDLGEADLRAAISIGPPRRNRKPVLQLLRPSGEPVGFVKIGWSDLTRELVTNEAYWLNQIDGKLPPGMTAPKLLLHQSTSELEIVVTTPLPIKATLKPAPPINSQLVLAMARMTGGGRSQVRKLPYLGGWRENPALSQVVDIGKLINKHSSIELELGLWHGDLTPWNTATSAETVMVWDWEFAADNRPVGFDLLHTAFELVRRAAPNNETSAIKAVLAETANILRPVLGAQPAPGLVAAYQDLYLAELVARETRLAGQGWEPNNLGPLDQLAAAALRSRMGQS